MAELVHPYLQMPIAPFTVLLGLVVVYWLLMILGGLELDFLDFDLDLDGDPGTHSSALDWGFAGLRWFNLGEVPLMVWMSAFAVAAWLTAAVLDRGLSQPTGPDVLAACLRTAGIGFLAAKALTQPLRGKLKTPEPNTAERMIGRTVIVTTTRADTTQGQASCPAEGAPLLINVRTTAGTLAKGDAAEIVDYSPDQHVYFIRSVAPYEPAAVAERSL